MKELNKELNKELSIVLDVLDITRDYIEVGLRNHYISQDLTSSAEEKLGNYLKASDDLDNAIAYLADLLKK